MDKQKTVKVCTANDKTEADMMIDILKQNGIAAYREGVGNADIVDIYTGNSKYGENLFVNERNADRARELLENFTNREGKEEYKRRSKASQLTGIIILIIFMLMLIYTFATSIS